MKQNYLTAHIKTVFGRPVSNHSETLIEKYKWTKQFPRKFSIYTKPNTIKTEKIEVNLPIKKKRTKSSLSKEIKKSQIDNTVSATVSSKSPNL